LKTRFSSARLTLAVIPVGLFAASVILTREHGPYYQRNNLDPEYNYLLNSLSLLTLHAPTHNDHPGVTLQILGAAVEWLKWFGGFLLGSRQSLSESVLSQPESYLHAMNVVLNVLLSGALYWSAIAVYRLSKSLSAPIVLQVTLLVYHQSFLALPRVSPEPLLMAEGLALMALLAPAVFVAQDGEVAKEPRLAGAAGAFFGLGLMTKITFAPWAAVVLLFPYKSQRRRFFTAAAATVLILLLPVATRIPYMMSWFTSLLTHAGAYGTGPVGLPAAHALATNLFWLWLNEPPFFVLLSLYVGILVLLLLFRPQDAQLRGPVRESARRLLLAGIVAMVAAIAMVTKHLVEVRYLLPALVLTAFVNSALCALALQSELYKPAARWLCVAGSVALVGVGLARNGPFLRRWVEVARMDQRDIAQVRALEDRLSGCEIIGSYAPSLPIYALAFGGDYSGGVHRNTLEKLYPGAIHYDPYGKQFLSFGFNQKIEDVQRMVRSGKCVLLESDPLDAAAVNTLRASDGIDLATLMTSANPFRPTVPTAVYQLHPASELNR
jgi:hypothetical protein